MIPEKASGGKLSTDDVLDMCCVMIKISDTFPEAETSCKARENDENDL